MGLDAFTLLALFIGAIERVQVLCRYYRASLSDKTKNRRVVLDGLNVLETLVADQVLNGEVARLEIGNLRHEVFDRNQEELLP